MLAIDRWRKWRPSDEKFEESPGCEPSKPSESTFEGFEGSTSGELPNYSDVPSDDLAEWRAAGEEMSKPEKRKPKPKRKPPVSVTSEDVMTLEEAAAFLRCHPRTLVRNADALHIPHRRIGTLWRFSRTELEAWMRKQESEAA